MAYETITQRNATTLGELFIYTSDIVPIFIPLLLTVFFLVIMLGSYIIPKNLTGRGDISASASVAGFTTAVAAALLSTVEGLINIQTLVISIVIAIATVLWLFFSRE